MQRYSDLQLQASSFPIDSINHACLRDVYTVYTLKYGAKKIQQILQFVFYKAAKISGKIGPSTRYDTQALDTLQKTQLSFQRRGHEQRENALWGFLFYVNPSSRFGYIYIGTLCLARGFTTTAVSTLLPPASSKFASTTFLKLLNGELEWLHQLLLYTIIYIPFFA